MSSDDKTQINITPPANGVEIGTQIIGTYEILEHIAAGGMGEVYRGVNIHTDEPVAIKIVLPSLAHDQKIIAMFQKEATVLSRLSHDAIVRYHVFTIDPVIKRPCLIMEFVDGLSLAKAIEGGRPLPEADVRVLLLRVASGLAKAHRAGVIHRDLSPDNVVLREGTALHATIIDFGIAKAANIGGGTLLGGQFAGKYNFVSPEQLGRFKGEVTGRSDIYALGLVAAAACLGHVLDMGDSPAAAVEARLVVPDLTGVPEGLRPLLEMMLEPDPDNRPESMDAIVTWLSAQGGVEGALPGEVTTAPGATGASQLSQVPSSLPPASRPPQSLPPASKPPVSQAPVSAPPANAGHTVLSKPPADTDSPFGAYTPPGGPGSLPPVSQAPVATSKGGGAGLVALLLLVLAAGGGGYAYMEGMIPGLAAPGVKTTEVTTDPVKPKPPATDTSDADAEAKAAAEAEAAAKAQAEAEAQAKAAADEQARLEAEARAAMTEAEAKAAQEAAAAKALADQQQAEAEAKMAAELAAAEAKAKQEADAKAAEAQAKAEAEATAAAAAETAKMAERVEWLRAYKAPECVHTAITSVTPTRITVDGFATSVEPFVAMLGAFRNANGVEPDIAVHLVSAQQCPLLAFLRDVAKANVTPPTLALDKDVLKGGEAIRGRIEGVEGRALWLMLVDANGIVYDLSSRLSVLTDGNATLALGLQPSTTVSGGRQPQMIVVVATSKPLLGTGDVSGKPAASVLPKLLSEITSRGLSASTAAGYFRFENK